MNQKKLWISGPAANGDYAIVESGGVIVGEAFHRVGDDAWRDAEANARLWAAAPDLRAALEALLAIITDVDTVYETETGRAIEQDFAEELEQARAALADAEAGDG